MLFAHDTEVALSAAAALVNTDGADGELLPDLPAFRDFVAEWGWTGVVHGSRSEWDAVRALRPRLRSLWFSDVDEVVALVNALLREAHALPQLVRHDDWDYHVHATAADAPLADRMAVEAAMALSDLVRLQELSRLRLCTADECENVLVDLSKNRSRRFCSTACANRTNVAAYRARQGSAPAS